MSTNNEINLQLEYIEKIKELNENNKKYYVITMGCKLNENDSEKLSGMLNKMNYTETDNFSDADIVIFNTCCVRENAEEKLFGKLGEAKKLHYEKGAIIAICGCMMQEEHMVQKVRKSYPFVEIIFGTHTLHKLPENIHTTLLSRHKNKVKITDILDIDGEIYEGLPIKRNDDKTASVTIMYGCNNFCTYCIVPYVRGRERSRNPEDILNEIRTLIKEGYKEIILLGQNVNSYMRSEMEKGIAHKSINTFAKLLNEIEGIEELEKISFISPHPKDFTDDVIDVIAKSDKISKFIHLPLQSGSSEVLKLMNRKYTKEQYLELAEKMRKKIPEIRFSTDIIVGFPGETEEDFEDTLDVVRQVKYKQVYMFIYSKREGTPAAKSENQVEEATKHERFNRLQKLVNEIVQENK